MSYHRTTNSIWNSLDKDYIEEGRGDIYKWGVTRSTKREGIRGWGYAFKKRFIDKSILRSFANNLTVSLLFQLILSGLCTYICQKLDLYLDVHISLFVSPIVFPLAFSINADFQRREHVLEDLALFKGGLIILFFCHRDWHVPAGLPQEFLKAVTNKLKGLILNVKEYLLTEKQVKRSFILQVIYEDFSDISQMNEKMRVALKTNGAALLQRVIHCHNLMFWAFERLRVIREYRSPRGIRSFTKVFIFVMPILLSPYYVFVGKSSNNTWGPYYISLISTFMFGTLQGVQDILDDPFDGISEDDVNLGSLEDWTAHSLLTNRTYTVGRFTVTASVKHKEETKEPLIGEARIIPDRNVSFRHRVNAPIRSILRRTSNRTDAHDSSVSEQDVDILYPEMALRLQSMKKKEFSGSTTILPGFHIKEYPQSDDNDDNSALGTPVSLARSASDSSEIVSRRRDFRKNVSFSHDLDDETNENSPERMSDSSLNANDSSPLLHDNNKTSERFESDQFSKDLLESMEMLQSNSGTERVAQAKQPSNIPLSLASLFERAPTQSQNDPPSQPVCSLPLTVTSPFLPEKPSEDKNGEMPVAPASSSSRFNVVNSGSNVRVCNSSPNSPIAAFQVSSADQNTRIEPRTSRFAITPASQSSSTKGTNPAQSIPTRTSSPATHVKVQLPSAKRFQVQSTAAPVDDKLGETNLGLSRSLSSCCEDTSKTNRETTQRPSRFSVNKPSEQDNLPGHSVPQEDRALGVRKSSYWDFSTEESLVDGQSAPKTANASQSAKVPSVHDVLELPDGCRGEVFI